MGGDLVEGNVIFDQVKETGDHGVFAPNICPKLRLAFLSGQFSCTTFPMIRHVQQLGS